MSYLNTFKKSCCFSKRISCEHLNNIHYFYSSISSVPCSSHSLSPLSSLSLKNPGDRHPLRVFRNRFQGSFDSAVGLVQVVVDDAQVKVLTVGCLHFSTLITRPSQFFILRWETHDLVLNALCVCHWNHLFYFQLILGAVLSSLCVYEHTGSLSYRQCLSNHSCIYSCLVHHLEHLKLWRLKEHNVWQELGGPQHFERLESIRNIQKCC